MVIRSKGERVFGVCNVLMMVGALAIFIIPLWVVLATSFVGQSEAIQRSGSYFLYPNAVDLSAYRMLLSNGSKLYSAYGVTLFRLIVGTGANLLFTVPLAYGLSKKDMPGRAGITMFVFFTMIFTGGMIPTYLLVVRTGLINTLWSLIVPCLISTWNCMLMRNFFMAIPESLEESARIDGASTVGILVRIVLPLSKASIATVGLFYAVRHWNSWFDAAMYINDSQKYPVQILLRTMVMSLSKMDINNEFIAGNVPPPSEGLKCAAIVTTTLPILALYPFVQRYFVQGMLVGSVKG